MFCTLGSLHTCLKLYGVKGKLLRPRFALCPQDWLSKFGYLPPADPVTGQLQTKEALTKAIKAMQRFGGLEETGVFGGCLFGEWKYTPVKDRFIQICAGFFVC